VGGGGEDGHAGADLGDDVLGGDHAGAGHRVQLRDLVLIRLAQRADLDGQLADPGGVVVDGGQHHRQDGGVLFGHEGAVQGFFELADLAAHGAAGELGQRLGVPFPGGDGLQHGPAGDPVDVGDYAGQLQVRFNWASSSSFSARCFSAVRAWVRCRRYRVWVRSRRISSGGTKLPASAPRSVTFANHTESSLSSSAVRAAP